jgi:hypothetical protein
MAGGSAMSIAHVPMKAAACAGVTVEPYPAATGPASSNIETTSESV